MAKQPSRPSSVLKRTVTVAGRKTSVSLEDAFWKALKEIAAKKNVSVQDLVSILNSERQHNNVSSAIRLFVLSYYRGQVRWLSSPTARR
jgi:predicted DNA-binding ribbon-helix-helix protein